MQFNWHCSTGGILEGMDYFWKLVLVQSVLDILLKWSFSLGKIISIFPLSKWACHFRCIDSLCVFSALFPPLFSGEDLTGSLLMNEHGMDFLMFDENSRISYSASLLESLNCCLTESRSVFDVSCRCRMLTLAFVQKRHLVWSQRNTIAQLSKTRVVFSISTKIMQLCWFMPLVQTSKSLDLKYDSVKQSTFSGSYFENIDSVVRNCHGLLGFP